MYCCCCCCCCRFVRLSFPFQFNSFFSVPVFVISWTFIESAIRQMSIILHIYVASLCKSPKTTYKMLEFSTHSVFSVYILKKKLNYVVNRTSLKMIWWSKCGVWCDAYHSAAQYFNKQSFSRHSFWKRLNKPYTNKPYCFIWKEKK